MVIANESALVIKGKDVVNNPAETTFIQTNGKVMVIINNIVPFIFGALRKALVSSDYIGFVTNLVSNSELKKYNLYISETLSNIYGVSDGLNISVYLAARSGNEKTTIQLYVAMTPSNVLWDPSDILTSRSVLTEVYYR